MAATEELAGKKPSGLLSPLTGASCYNFITSLVERKIITSGEIIEQIESLAAKEVSQVLDFIRLLGEQPGSSPNVNERKSR